MISLTGPNVPAAHLLQQLRLLVLGSPAAAIGHVRYRLAKTNPDPPLAVDLRILLAEALHRHLQAVDAIDASTDAAQAAAALHPPDEHRLVTALAVAAHIATSIGHPEAVAAVDAYRDVLHHLVGVDARSLVLADALRAVAVHHRDPAQGHRDLTHLIDTAREHPPLVAVLHAGHAAMRDLAECGSRRPAGPPPPMPGGVLQPDRSTAPPGFLADLINRPPAGQPPPPAGTTPQPARPAPSRRPITHDLAPPEDGDGQPARRQAGQP